MKRQIRSFLISLIGLKVLLEYIPGIELEGDIQTFFLVSATLFIVSLLIKPVVKIILLPINAFTINFVSLIVNFAALFLITFIIPQFQISAFEFAGYSYYGFVIPALLVNQLATLVIADIIYSFVGLILHWVSE